MDNILCYYYAPSYKIDSKRYWFCIVLSSTFHVQMKTVAKEKAPYTIYVQHTHLNAIWMIKLRLPFYSFTFTLSCVVNILFIWMKINTTLKNNSNAERKPLCLIFNISQHLTEPSFFNRLFISIKNGSIVFGFWQIINTSSS